MLVVPSVIPTKVGIQVLSTNRINLDSRVRGNDEQCSALYSVIVQLSIVLQTDGPLAMLDF